jgi:hypothetical protein
MIGRICRFYNGYNHIVCLEMTLSQIQGMYWESYIQEARERIKRLSDNAAVSAGGDSLKTKMDQLEFQADPPDPEADGMLSKEDMKGLGIKLRELLT